MAKAIDFKTVTNTTLKVVGDYDAERGEIITDDGELDILEAMKKFNGVPITFSVTLKSIEEHDIED